MDHWTESEAAQCVANYERLRAAQKKSLLDVLNDRFPPAVYREHLARQRAALRNAETGKKILDGARQSFPPLIAQRDVCKTAADLAGCAVVLTAGGDGERLRASLAAAGAGEEELKHFTKATCHVPGFPGNRGTLHAACAMIADLCRKSGLNVPVVVTTGPRSSATARIIPETLEKAGFFGLKNVRILAQDERLHLTLEGTMAALCDGDAARPAANPDETGGPFVKLLKRGEGGEQSVAEWLVSLGCSRILALQATGVYDPSVVLSMAAAGKGRDFLGVGVLRTEFGTADPFGSFVLVERAGKKSLAIVEQGVRNDATRALTDPSGQHFLPYNTGLYVFDIGLLSSARLPDYATPPKEILPELPRSPKIGYAITDIVSFAKNPAVLAIDAGAYANLKSMDDFSRLLDVAKRCGILELRWERA
jgi:hypothetical protein